MTSKSAVNFRTTYIMMGLVAVLLGVLAIYVFFGGDKKPNPKGFLLETFHALDTKPDEITGFEIEKGDEKIVFNRQADGRWRMKEPIEARADSDRVEMIVRELLEARREEKGTDLTLNLGVHGLDKPAVKLTLRKGERSATISLGKVTIGGDEALVYVLTSDESKKPQALKKKLIRDLFKAKPPDEAGTAAMVIDLNEFRTKKLLGEGMTLEAAPSHIDGIKLTSGDRVVHLSRKNPERVWRFVKPEGYGDVQLDTPVEKRNPNTVYNLSSLLNNALSIEVNDVKDYLPNAKDLSALGLDPSSEGVLRIDLERQDAFGTETLWISKQNAKSEKDKVYVRYQGDAAVAQINGEKARILQNFLKDPTLLRDSTFIKLRLDRVDAVDVTIDKKAFELRKIDGNWKIYDGDKMNVGNKVVIDALLFKLTERQNVRGYPATDATDAALGFNAPQAEIRIWEDSILSPESPDPKARPKVKLLPTTHLMFGAKDGGIVYVRRYMGTAKADAKLSDDLLPLATRGRLDYVDIALKPFNPLNVEKIGFLLNGETWEIERTPSTLLIEPAEWKIIAPASMKGKLGNAQQIKLILDSYAEMKSDKVDSENPSKDQLATRGLDPDKPVFKLALKVKDEPTERVYYLGNPVAGKLHVYTKTSLSDYVFESLLARIELVTKSRLVDPTLYKIEPGNLKMTLRGWIDSSTTGQPQVLEMERQAGGFWKSKGDVKLDDQKVEEFFTLITRPQSVDQVVEKTGARPEQKLDLKLGALEIEFDMGDKKPITLMLGAPVDKDSKTIFASTNQAPGDVYTLNAEKLLPAKEKPAVFWRK